MNKRLVSRRLALSLLAGFPLVLGGTGCGTVVNAAMKLPWVTILGFLFTVLPTGDFLLELTGLDLEGKQKKEEMRLGKNVKRIIIELDDGTRQEIETPKADSKK